MSVTATIPVRTASRAYDVLVGHGLIDRVGEICRATAGGGVAAIVSDSNVAPLYAGQVEASLGRAGYRSASVIFEAGERGKRLSTLERLLEGIADAELSRDDVVVALGGGVAGDMGGLAAALYLRGIQVVQVPTSLLAMVDSSVGGKTAVDLACGKNLVGCYFQPSAVVADVDCLGTLSHELLTDSCGEVIKHGVLADERLFSRMASRPLNAGGYGRAELARIVARNVEIKRDVVSADETERGLRQTLNLGHTIGHAIEAASGFALGHGASVAAGLCCIARAAAAKGWCDEGVSRTIEDAVSAFGLPVDTDIDHATLLRYATHDKKRRGGTLNVIVPLRIGRVEVRTIAVAELGELIALGCGTHRPGA
ncbi:MAG: 3-dehydroquinate synthase [Acidobacteriota bacterium]|nr:3-dehydroquinate synthase [Acidobacteriota bacterium]